MSPVVVGFGDSMTGSRRIATPVSVGSGVLVDGVGRLPERLVEVKGVGLRRPALGDVFFGLTGHGAVVAEGEEA